MIDKNEQGKGYGQAALQEIIKYFKDNGADMLYLSTEPENEPGLHIYRKAGFRETGIISGDEAVLMRMLKGPNKLIRDFYGVNVDKPLRIHGKKGYGVSVAVHDGDGDLLTYCFGSGRYGEEFPVNPDMLFQAGSVSKPMFALTLMRYVDRGKLDLDADISSVVPEYVKKGPVTFAALLSHTAGYNLHGFPGFPANHAPLTLEDVLDGKGITPKLRRIRPYGAQCMYSGGGYELAELAFTRLTGTSLREAFQKEVAEPLGLKRTGFFQPLDEDLVENAAFGGRLGEKEDPAHGYHYYPEHAAAGLWTTPTELVRIGIAISRSYRKGGFLKKKTARRMLEPVRSIFGLGFQRFNKALDEKGIINEELLAKFGEDVGYHDGANAGFLTEWVFSLKKDVCVASMVNRSDDKAVWGLFELNAELFRNAKN